MVDEASIAATRGLWTECERQLYPMAVSDAPGYQRAIMAARALADQLGEVASSEELAALWPRAGELLASVLLERGLPAGSMPRDWVAGAAFALRDREIREAAQRKAHQERIEAARQGGEAWIVLDEAGDLAAELVNPYRCTEMHLDSGFAVVAMVQADPGSGDACYVVTVVRLDPGSGELLDASPKLEDLGLEGWAEFQGQEELIAHRATVRARICERTAAAAV